jgi:hypothetical protein
MSRPLSLDDLWNSAPSAKGTLDARRVSRLPEGARRYLGHAIAPGTPLASALRLRMHGEIRLKGWCSFSAEQVICWQRGFIWRASVRMHGLPVRGSDRFVDGQGAMSWKLFGIVPMVDASGPDITRSAAGRLNIESIWLPSVLCGDEVAWTASDTSHLHARFTAHNETAEVDCIVDEEGALQSVSMARWGNPEGAEFHYAGFGARAQEEGRFAGYRIPTRLRVGWYFGTERFDSEGEFFRATIDEAAYR